MTELERDWPRSEIHESVVDFEHQTKRFWLWFVCQKDWGKEVDRYYGLGPGIHRTAKPGVGADWLQRTKHLSDCPSSGLCEFQLKHNSCQPWHKPQNDPRLTSLKITWPCGYLHQTKQATVGRVSGFGHEWLRNAGCTRSGCFNGHATSRDGREAFWGVAPRGLSILVGPIDPGT